MQPTTQLTTQLTARIPLEGRLDSEDIAKEISLQALVNIRVKIKRYLKITKQELWKEFTQ